LGARIINTFKKSLYVIKVGFALLAMVLFWFFFLRTSFAKITDRSAEVRPEPCFLDNI